MTFGRWLLVHSLSISILVMLGVGYTFKEELKLNQAYLQLLDFEPPTVSLKSDNASTSEKLEADKESIEAIVVTPKEKLEPVVDTSKALKKTEQQWVEKEASTVKQIDVQKQETGSKSVRLKTTKKATQSSTHVPAIAKNNVLKAREAYWNKNFKYAIQLYRDEIKNNPNQPDLYGELGNIYYGLDNYDVASDYYLKAGELFVIMNQQNKAKQIYEILMSMDKNKANRLLNFKNYKKQ